MRMIKQYKEDDKLVVLNQIFETKKNYQRDPSNDAKLSVLEKAIAIVDKNKETLGQHGSKSMSSLQKNRLALGLMSTMDGWDGNI